MSQGDVGKVYKALASQQQSYGFKLQVRRASLVSCARGCAWSLPQAMLATCPLLPW
jgi:hypothetical protein